MTYHSVLPQVTTGGKPSPFLSSLEFKVESEVESLLGVLGYGEFIPLSSAAT